MTIGLPGLDRPAGPAPGMTLPGTGVGPGCLFGQDEDMSTMMIGGEACAPRI